MKQTHREVCFREYDEECQVCGDTENVHVHHRDGNRVNNEIENLIPLCHSCHKNVHHGNRESELMSQLVNELRINTTPDIDTAEFDDVPEKASVIAKETWDDCYYYYFVWREGDNLQWHYIGPVEDYKVHSESRDHQKSLDSFVAGD